jgi:hypothetical protein
MRKLSFLVIGAAVAAGVGMTSPATAGPAYGAAAVQAASARPSFQDIGYHGSGYRYYGYGGTGYRCSGSPAEC